MVNSPVLVLNQNYDPLNVCQARRAVVLLYRGKAEVVEKDSGEIRSAYEVFSLPSVIRLLYMIKRPRQQRKLTRLEVFSRDKYACQYCGRDGGELTLDHVVPRYRGGEHAWHNVVSACIPCNRRKAGGTPAEAGMNLIRQPRVPLASGVTIPYHHLRSRSHWLKFAPQ